MDCNDTNNGINPGISEVCDGVDNNCNGTIDENLALNTYYADSDGDGYGNPGSSIQTCSATLPTGYSSNNLDCNDANNGINPGISEVCDGVDNNCNGTIDENLTLNTYYADSDGDGYGNPVSSIQNCGHISGYVDNKDDCDDLNSLVYPFVNDIPGNAIDENCDGVDGYLSINNSLQAFHVKVFPNPAVNFIQLSGNLFGICQVRIINIQGQIILDCSIKLQDLVNLNVNDILPGSYMLEISHLDSGLKGLTKLLIIR